MSADEDVKPFGLLPLPNVQLWETENSERLDSSRGWSHRRAIPCLVDAPTLRAVNSLKIRPEDSTGAIVIFTNNRDVVIRADVYLVLIRTHTSSSAPENGPRRNC